MQRLTIRPSRQKGITLIESLIALVVAALGILGIVGIQMRTLADTQTSVRRAQAIRLIEDLSERMRVNPNGLSVLSSYSSAWNNTPTPGNCDSGCDQTSLVAFDIATWKESVKNNLPLGQANIFLAPGEAGAANRYQLGVMIAWRENERFDADANYMDAINAVTAGGGGGAITCPVGFTCHLQYLTVAARCASYTASGAEQYFCPGA